MGILLTNPLGRAAESPSRPARTRSWVSVGLSLSLHTGLTGVRRWLSACRRVVLAPDYSRRCRPRCPGCAADRYSLLRCR
eukprot:COSAG02_NODE_90_length_37755_cov_29.833364_19_plen_80_part_00